MIACFFTLEDICTYMYNSNILNKNLKRRQLNTHSVEGLLPGLLMYFCPLISIGAVGGTNKVTACCLISRTNQTNHTNNANNNNQLYTPTKKPSAQPNLSKHGQCPPHIPSPGRPSGSFLQIGSLRISFKTQKSQLNFVERQFENSTSSWLFTHRIATMSVPDSHHITSPSHHIS